MNFRNLLHQLNRRDTKILPKFNKFSKILIFCLAIFCCTFIVKSIFAQTTYIQQKQNSIEKGNNQEAWLNEAMGSNMMSIVQMVTGKIPFNADGSVKEQSYIPGGAIGIVNNLNGVLYSQPTSGLQYIAQIKNDFLGKPAYAQGVGFPGLQPLLPMWREFRNVIYILTSLFFIGIGIMVMLRVKISPQAIVTLQSAIPKLITTLILVTFSYAIAGLIIDLSNFFLALFLAILFNGKGIAFGSDLFNANLTNLGLGTGIPLISLIGDYVKWGYTAIASVFGYAPFSLHGLTGASFGTVNELTAMAIPSSAGWALGQVVGQVFLGILCAGLGQTILGGAGRDILGGIGAGVGNVSGGLLGGLLMPMILAILMIFWLIKLYFGLLKCYITVIFKIIIAPLEIGIGAIPNMKMGFSTWVMDIVAHISVFPITILFIVFINYLTEMFAGGSLWAPSVLSISSLGGNSKVIAAGIGLAGLGMLSKLPSLIPEFIFQLKPSPFGKAIGETFAPVGAMTGKFAKSNASAGMDKLDKTFGMEKINNAGTGGATEPSSRFTKTVSWAGRLAGTRSGDKRRNG